MEEEWDGVQFHLREADLGRRIVRIYNYQITREDGANTQCALTFEDRYKALLSLIKVLPSSYIEDRRKLVSRHKI